MPEKEKVTFFKKWLISLRPFSFPASTMPVVFGTVLAYVYGGGVLNIWLFLLAFFGMLILHAAANVLNDIIDFKKGLDKVPAPVSGGVVRRLITIREARIASTVLFVTGTLMGLLLAYLTSWWILLIGVPGIMIGVFYSLGGKVALKYHALGDLAVFLNFGTLGALGAWFVQTGYFSWIPVIWSLPMSMLVIGILHANNWRDITSDREGNIRTIASMLGDKASLRYYGYLLFGPFIVILGLILVPYFAFPELTFMPFTFGIVILSLPMALKLWHKALRRKKPENPVDFLALDGATAQFNLVFGLLCTLALVLEAVLRSYI
jgi:1,4-dihydroxy-2-naphthoate octaprenyltransferase